MDYNFNLEDITREKSLWDIYKSSRNFKISKFNTIVLIICTILSGCYAIIKDAEFLIGQIQSLSNFGFTFSIAILGFLIAGFTIFSTVTKPSLLLKMMEVPHEETGLPYLKYNFFNIMLVFIYYLMVTSIFLFVILFFHKNTLLSAFIEGLLGDKLSQYYIIKIFYVFIVCCIAFLMLQLKTFIFNVYSITMTNLRWEAYEQQRRRKSVKNYSKE